MKYAANKRKEMARRMVSAKGTKPFFSETGSDMGGNRGNKNDPGNARPVRSASEMSQARPQMKMGRGQAFKGRPGEKYIGQ